MKNTAARPYQPPKPRQISEGPRTSYHGRNARIPSEPVRGGWEHDRER